MYIQVQFYANIILITCSRVLIANENDDEHSLLDDYEIMVTKVMG